jgi:hypothetical protein
LLRQMGLVTSPTPPPPSRRKRPTLRVVVPEEGSITPRGE